MACNCGSGNRLAKAGVSAQAGTYRVMVTDGEGPGAITRKVYESVSETAAKTVAANFANAKILVPGQ